MQHLLEDLIYSLKSALQPLNGSARDLLQAALHDSNSLPDKQVSKLASEALDLLSELRILLEPGHLVLADHFLGYMSTKCLVTAVELNIPDLLKAGPQTLAALATATDSRLDRLSQIMRMLYHNGIFSYDPTADTYSNNHVSELLRTDHWTQWRNWVDLYGNEFYDMARGLPTSCHKDAVRTPAQINYDTDDSMFKFFTDKGWVSKFHRTLSGGAIAQAPGILADYPWEDVSDASVLDVGGGGGGLMALLLRKHKNMKGGILDLEKVIGAAKVNFHSPDEEYADIGNQIPEENLIIGNFMESVPSFEVYTMKWCLHDWDDERAGIILRNIRRAIRKGPLSRLVILESVLKDGHMGRMSRYADMNMMVTVGGRERDEDNWKNLASKTGWKLRKIYELRNAWPCAIEFVPDWEEIEEQASPGQVVAEMRFLEPWDPARGNPYIRIDPAEGFDRMNFKWEDHSVAITDSRPRKHDFDLDVQGFAYYDDAVDNSLISVLRGNEKNKVKDLYYPHVEAFVKKITGTQRVIIFDHTQRKRRLELGTTQNDDGKEQPATMVHCDQSEKGAIRRLQMNIGADEDVSSLLRGRVQMLKQVISSDPCWSRRILTVVPSVWRPLNEPVQDWPLALMDYQAVDPSDMHPCDLLKGEDEDRGQTVTFTHSRHQEWYFLDRQRTSEVTVIKVWDSKADCSQYCAHAAFNHLHAPPDSPPRESVEVRCLVLYEAEPGAAGD